MTPLLAWLCWRVLCALCMFSVLLQLDRWSLSIEEQLDFDEEAFARENDIPLSRSLPLSVCNNYFSFGMDAWAALNFHLAREKDPAKFSSRIHNKAYYGIQGAKDIFKRKYKNLHAMVRLWVRFFQWFIPLVNKRVSACECVNESVCVCVCSMCVCVCVFFACSSLPVVFRVHPRLMLLLCLHVSLSFCSAMTPTTPM